MPGTIIETSVNHHITGTQASNIPNVAGGSAGASVTTAVSFTVPINLGYAVRVDAGQSAFGFASGKTSTGFNVTLVPVPSTATLAAGTFNVMVTLDTEF